jgi:AraC-like DNA-binding protein
MPIPLQQIDKWFEEIKPNLNKEKDGFYEESFLINSPQACVESWSKLPFRSHNRKAQIISSTSNAYAKSIVHYQEIEEGLWVILSEIKYDSNIHFKFSSYKHIPANYYLLTFITNKLPHNGTDKAMWNDLIRNYQTWSIVKPGKTINKAINVTYLKNMHVSYYYIFFSEKWFQKNILPIEELKKTELSTFLASDKDYIIWPTLEINSQPSFDAAWYSIQQKGNQGAANPLELKIHTLTLINLFVAQFDDKEKSKRYFKVEDADRKRVLQAERIIMDCLLTNFPSIDEIAKKLHVSSSKLKNDFKLQFGIPMYQYYQSKKMAYAKELLLKDNVLIKDVAYFVGYENISKFSATFKKYHGCLPSDVYQKKN